MADNGVQPNTKTFTALIGSVGRMNTMEQAMEIIEQLLSHDKDRDSQTQTYSALMSACEKAGQWDLAVALFDKMSADVSLPIGRPNPAGDPLCAMHTSPRLFAVLHCSFTAYLDDFLGQSSSQTCETGFECNFMLGSGIGPLRSTQGVPISPGWVEQTSRIQYTIPGCNTQKVV